MGKSSFSSMPVNVNSIDCQHISDNNSNQHIIIVDIIIELLTESSCQFKIFALIDSGSMENFCDIKFATINILPFAAKTTPVEILTIDGSPISLGKVTQDCSVQMSMGSHSEQIEFSITKPGQSLVILGIPWLKKHDPRITWSTRSISFDSISCVQSCFKNTHSIKALPTYPKYSQPSTVNL